ncbi:lipid IV(A) 3-deoxy-D-manno-octulosonic acid transferase [Campylobacter sp. CX2-8023-23]|uniref:lipid IV(A) 3-deoxy-D-manno-octulosonic acid transferase n=1 Tax=Campylobacter porcelli TaxID=1660073 RepID=UPI002EC4A8F4|nr:lipid IV(A) 3-deoxy-D-manno-octulosonic acid transferase [Campylobacter sp. CX2-8023-23]
MIYTLFTALLLGICSPFLWLLSFKQKFIRSIRARFFLIKNPKPKLAKYHFHACSLGEARAIEHLVRRLGDCRVSVITQTGFDYTNKYADCRFLPFECFLPFWLSKSDVLIVFEAELWLNLFKVAKSNGSKTVLLNARISDKSYKNYLRFKFYYRWLFKYVDLVLAQSDLDKERLATLGAKNIKVVGNIKSANLPKPSKNYVKLDKRVIVIASSHQNEEINLLKNLNLSPNDQLFIAPRHPERFAEVCKIIKDSIKSDMSFEKFSDNMGLRSQIILVDTLGELVNLYQIADIVVLCGSFEYGIGGHNPIEAAQFGCKILSGEYIHNQKDLYKAVSGIEFCSYENVWEKINSNLKSTKIINICDMDKIIKEIKG